MFHPGIVKLVTLAFRDYTDDYEYQSTHCGELLNIKIVESVDDSTHEQK
jgi:hypothetical protein